MKALAKINSRTRLLFLGFFLLLPATTILFALMLSDSVSANDARDNIDGCSFSFKVMEAPQEFVLNGNIVPAGSEHLVVRATGSCEVTFDGLDDPFNFWFSHTEIDTNGPAEFAGYNFMTSGGVEGRFNFEDINNPDAGRYFYSSSETPVTIDNPQTATNWIEDNVEIADGGVGENPEVPITPEENPGGDPEATCEDVGGFAWVMCPLVKMLSEGFESLGNQIEAMLNIPEARYNDPRLKSAWEVFRNLAYTLLVPIMLVMVIGTALGFEFVSAYTVKKALPRLVIAAIFITLSWEITKLLIEIVHGVGMGVRGIVLNPFGVTSFADVFTPSTGSAVGQGALIFGSVVLVGLSTTVLGLLLSFLGTVGLILLTIFMFLVAREIFILALMVVAPLAILAWIFPGKTKLWSSWWGLFSKLLYIYPIIMLVTAIGLVFASLIDADATNVAENGFVAAGLSNVLSPIIKVAAFIIPYGLIPIAFKTVGGVVGNLAGMVNDKERGMFDRLKKGRQAGYSKANQELRAGTLTNRGGHIGERVGRGLGRVRSGPRGWVPGSRGRTYATESMAHGRAGLAAQAAQNPELVQFGQRDDDGNAVLALSGGVDAEDASQDLKTGWLRDDVNLTEEDAELRRVRAVAAARSMGVNKANSQVAMQTMMQNKARSVGGGDWNTVQRGINRLHGANTTAAEQQADFVQYLGRASGRADLGAGTVRQGLERTGAHQTVRGHVNAVREATADSARRYNTAIAGNDVQGALDAAAEMTAYRNALGADVSEDNKRIVYDMFETVGLDPSSSQSIDQQFAEHIQSDRLIGPTDTTQNIRMQEQIRNRAGLFERGTDPRHAAGPAGGPGAGGPDAGGPDA
ncbi:hypothetical protein BH23PAT2_BH23PAT2_09890 [soil metagenome]